MLKYLPSPTAQRFLDSRAYVKIFMGPVGGGKSTAALMELVHRSINQQAFNGKRRTKHMIVRNTLQQLKSTVKPLIDEWLIEKVGGAIGDWRLTDNTFEMRFALPDGTEVHSDFILLPADTPQDVRRLLSVEVSDAWLEEAREIDPEVFSGVQGRCARWPNVESGGVTYPGIICSTNPPPMGTWWQEVISEPPRKWEVFLQPPALLDDGQLNVGQIEGVPAAENIQYLDPDYYDNLTAGKTDDWIDVYLKNKFGAGGFGQPVFRQTFRRDFHISKAPLSAVSIGNAPIIIGLDNGLQAAAVVGQQDARGRVNILAEAFVPDGVTMGVEKFFDSILIPLLRARFPRIGTQHYLVVADPACFQRSQANEVTIAMGVQARGYQCIRAPGTGNNDPERRIGAVEGLLMRSIDGGAGLLLDPSCQHLARALEWGYRNKKLANGQQKAEPEKNHFSHIADALQYFAMHFNTQFHPASSMFRTQKRQVKSVKYAYS